MPLPTHTIAVCRLLIATLAMLLATFSHAVPDTITYQGYLTNAAGVPVSGPVNISVRIYDEAGSALLYEETQSNVAVTVGLFQIAIGDGSPVSGTFGPALFQGPMAAGEFELEVNGETLAPRRPLRSTPYAQAAGDALLLGGQAPYEYLQLDFTGRQTIAFGAFEIDGGSQSVTTAGDYLYDSARTRTYAITPDRFNADGDSTLWVLAALGLYRYANTQNIVYSTAGFNLPGGARLSAISCHFYDPNIVGAITTLWASVYVRQPGSLSVFQYGALLTDSLVPSSSNSVRTRSAEAVSNPLPDGAPLQMSLRWQTSNISSSLRFYGCDVEYTVTKVGP